MPSFNLTVTVTDGELNALQTWFPRWNAQNTVPYADLRAAAEDLAQHQINTWIEAAQPRTLLEAYNDADATTQAEVRAALKTILGVDVG